MSIRKARYIYQPDDLEIERADDEAKSVDIPDDQANELDAEDTTDAQS